MHTIELIGSYTSAVNGDETTKITTTRKDPVPVLCRELIRRGVDPQDTVHVTRSGMSVWKKDRTLGKWADVDIMDTNDRGIVQRPYRPFEMAG